MVRALRTGRDHPGRPGHRRPCRHRGHGRAHRRRRHRAGRLRPGGQARRDRTRVGARRDDHGRRRRQRRSRARRGRCRCGAGRAGSDRVVGGRRRRADRRPDRRPGRRDPHRAPLEAIALQAVLVGMGLSLVAMVVAAVGLLPPAAGAVVQEVIDVLAIGIALRAVLPGRSTPSRCRRGRRHRPAAAAEHDAVLPVIEQIRRGRCAVDTRTRPRPGARSAGPAGGRAAPARARRRGAC
jgi:hypothetical protein